MPSVLRSASLKVGLTLIAFQIHTKFLVESARAFVVSVDCSIFSLKNGLLQVFSWSMSKIEWATRSWVDLNLPILIIRNSKRFWNTLVVGSFICISSSKMVESQSQTKNTLAVVSENFLLAPQFDQLDCHFPNKNRSSFECATRYTLHTRYRYVWDQKSPSIRKVVDSLRWTLRRGSEVC